MHATAVQVVEAAFHGVGPGRLDIGGEARRPKPGVEPLGDLLAGLAGQAEDFGLDLFDGGRAHGVEGASPVFAGNLAPGWHLAWTSRSWLMATWV